MNTSLKPLGLGFDLAELEQAAALVHQVVPQTPQYAAVSSI